jgi:hypothetical protein
MQSIILLRKEKDLSDIPRIKQAHQKDIASSSVKTKIIFIYRIEKPHASLHSIHSINMCKHIVVPERYFLLRC